MNYIMNSISFFRITILFGILLINESVFPQWLENSKEEIISRTGFKECKVYEYSYKYGEINKKSKRLVNAYTFDKDGIIITEKNVDWENKISNYVHKVVLSAKNIEDKIYQKDGTPDRKYVFSYNSKGKLIERKNCGLDDSPTCWKAIYEYDQNGRLMKTSSYSIENSSYPSGTSTYTYINQYAAESLEKTEGRGDSFKKTYKFDESGKVVEEVIFNWPYSNSAPSKSIFSYDNKGNIIEQIEYRADEPQTKYEYIY